MFIESIGVATWTVFNKSFQYLFTFSHDDFRKSDNLIKAPDNSFALNNGVLSYIFERNCS